MPIQFLTSEHIAQYGQYAEEPTPQQLAKYFYLDNVDLSIIANLREEHTSLGFALQIGI